MPDRKAFVIGISGCSTSGKTTLAHILCGIFPHTFILHGDDFYKPQKELPVKNGKPDWDSVDSLSIPDMEKAVAHIQATGEFPPNVKSKEDQNTQPPLPVSSSLIESTRARVHAWLQPNQPGHEILIQSGLKLCLFEGFLLYTPRMQAVINALDVKLFLRVSRVRLLQRRVARNGYVTLEGLWHDPPGYVEEVVWPNYVEAHKWLFEGGDVEGRLDEGVLEKHGVRAQNHEGADVDFVTSLDWAVETIMRDLEMLWKAEEDK